MCVKIAPKQNILDWAISLVAESEQESAWVKPHQIQSTPRPAFTNSSLREPRVPCLLDSVLVLYNDSAVSYSRFLFIGLFCTDQASFELRGPPACLLSVGLKVWHLYRFSKAQRVENPLTFVDPQMVAIHFNASQE